MVVGLCWEMSDYNTFTAPSPSQNHKAGRKKGSYLGSSAPPPIREVHASNYFLAWASHTVHFQTTIVFVHDFVGADDCEESVLLDT